MRTLVVTPTCPVPSHTGGRLRILHSLRSLASRHEVTLVTPCRDGSERGALARLERDLDIAVVGLPQRPAKARAGLRALCLAEPFHVAMTWSVPATRAVQELLHAGHFDLLYCHFLKTSANLPRHPRATLTVLDHHGLCDVRAGQMAQHLSSRALRLFCRLDESRWKRFQQRHLPSFDVILTVSDDERRTIVTESGLPPDRVLVSPNGIDPALALTRAAPERPCLLFVGSMHVLMNEVAAARLVEEVLPEVRRHVDAAVRLVGGTPRRRIRALGARPDVTVTGSVDSVAPYYRDASVFVAPLTFGTGTKIKVLEAMNAGVPVVTTPVGVRGLDDEVRRHAFVGDTPAELARLVVELLTDPALASRAARAARSAVRARYPWDAVYGGTLRRIEGMLEHQRSQSARSH